MTVYRGVRRTNQIRHFGLKHDDGLIKAEMCMVRNRTINVTKSVLYIKVSVL